MDRKSAEPIRTVGDAHERVGTMTNDTVRSASAPDAAAIARICNCYIQNTAITFWEETVSAQVMATRMADVQSISLLR